MKERSPIVATLLSIFIPFYILYWFYDTSKQLDAKGGRAPSLLLLLAPLILILFLFFATIGGAFFASIGTASGADEGMAGIFLLLFPLAAIFTLVYFYKYGAAVEQVTNKALTKGLLFVLFWLVSPAGVFLVQDKLNQGGATKKSARKAAVPSPDTNQ